MSQKLQQDLAINIESAFKILLESKHLYQSIQVDISNAETLASSYLSEVFSGATGSPRISAKGSILGVENKDVYLVKWVPTNPASRRLVPITATGSDLFALQWIMFTPPSVRLVCAKCAERLPFNLLKAEVVESDISDIHDLVDKYPGQQTFILVYQCQGCRDLPETMLIRRVGAKLTLAGRSVIERVVVSPAIPRSHSRYLSDAIVANNSGQLLAAVFLQRTFIEQFVRSVVRTETYADKALEAYAESLPIDFKARFPSLKDLYARLSVAIHDANATEDLFASVQNDIVQHFEARKLFQLSL